MQGFDRKKINFIIIFIFGYFSIYNISKFNNYETLKAAYNDDLIELNESLPNDNDNQVISIDEKFKLTKKKDESLIAGFTLDIDNTRLDASIKKRLNMMKKQLKTN